MRIELWFDFNDESQNAIKNLNKALKTFIYRSEVDVFYRSNVIDTDNFKLHEIYHYGRKKGLGSEFLIDIYKFRNDLLSLYEKYSISEDDINNEILNNEMRKIVLNQKEHSELQKITKVPTITMTHKIRITNEFTVDSIKKQIIIMFEKDSGIVYCEEDDCIR